MPRLSALCACPASTPGFPRRRPASALLRLLLSLLLLTGCAAPLFAANAPTPAAVPNGTVRVELSLPSALAPQQLQIYAYKDATPLEQGSFNYDQLKATPGATAAPLPLAKDHLEPLLGWPDNPHLDLPPGIYDIAVTPAATSNSAVWFSNVHVQANTPVDLKISLETPGSVNGTFKGDQSLFKDDGSKRPLTHVGLIRDDHVWAAGSSVDAQSFAIPNVPPGTYTLVLMQTAEHLLFAQEKVVVASGLETKIEALVKRSEQTALTVTFTDPDAKYVAAGGSSLKLYNSGLHLTFPQGPSIPGTLKTMGPGYKEPAAKGPAAATAPTIYLFPTVSTLGQCKLYLIDPKYKPLDGQTVTPGRATLDATAKDEGDARLHWPYPVVIHLADPPDLKKPVVAKPPAPAPVPAPSSGGGINPLGGRKSGGGY